MENNPHSASDKKGSVSNEVLRQRCLEHAKDLVESAERVLGGDNAYPNIAYHLAILSMEEIGKAGMLASRAAIGNARDGTSLEKRLDDHVFKLMWAVWSPTLSSGKIGPEEFQKAREFAESTHARRLAGLYVDYAGGEATGSPRDLVSLGQATSLVGLAKARLAMEAAYDVPVPGEQNEDLEWFLATTSDEIGQKRLFSQKFIQKHQEFAGDTRAWVRWAREEFAKIAADEKEQLRKELARQASSPGEGKPKWLVKVRLQTPSHSLRQKALNYWNERIEMVKLRAVGKKNTDLLLEMTLYDNITLEQLFDAGMSYSKLYIAALNIGTAGFFWYELSGQTEAYYESIRDLEKPSFGLRIAKRRGLPKEWSEGEQPEGQQRRIPLEESNLHNAIMCLAAFGPMSDGAAGPIFGEYLKGLLLLSKADLHLRTETQARESFLAALRRAMVHFEDCSADDADWLASLGRALEPVIPDPSHRTIVLGGLDGVPGDEHALSAAVSAKRVADLYLVIVAKRRWLEFVRKNSEEAESKPSSGSE